VVAVGRRILPKANLVDEASQCLRMLSGRNHLASYYTAICLVTPEGDLSPAPDRNQGALQRLSEGGHPVLYRLRANGRGKAGGYRGTGAFAGSFRGQDGRLLQPTSSALPASMNRWTLLGGEGFFPSSFRLVECQADPPKDANKELPAKGIERAIEGFRASAARNAARPASPCHAWAVLFRRAAATSI